MTVKIVSLARRYWMGISILVVLVLALIVAFTRFAPVGVDWFETYHPAVQNWQNPYDGSKFTNPPWALLFLPHGFLPINAGNAVNLVLNLAVLLLVIRRFGGGLPAILMVFTSPFILDLARTNNIDWIPALGLVLPPSLGMVLLATKPQSIGLVALIWWKQEKFRLRVIAPVLAILGLSFLIYGLWFTDVAGLPEDAGLWNIAPFPFGIPLGLYLLYLAWRSKDADDGVLLAALSTVFITPYVAPYSLNTVMALGASRYRREAFIAWVASWIYVIYTARRNAILFA